MKKFDHVKHINVLSARLADAERERDTWKTNCGAQVAMLKLLETERDLMCPVVEAADLYFRKWDEDGVWTKEDAKYQLQDAILAYRAAKGGQKE